MAEITELLAAVENGERSAAELLPLVYEELRRLAAWRLANERPG
ncbi:MAG TPA: ECF-type sigma factor, partial [Candidatus Paceibacterota bacterium]|nr:ECF-type sigma factor [Candidatus Paceibacterota bacterium]